MLAPQKKTIQSINSAKKIMHDTDDNVIFDKCF